MDSELTFRYAERKDTALILKFIKGLAEYEKMLDEIIADEETLEEWIFDRQKAVEFLRKVPCLLDRKAEYEQMSLL